MDNDFPDDNPKNNDFSVDVTIPFPGLFIDKNGELTINPGESMEYTITYQNTNRQRAEGVYIVDRLPDVEYSA